MDIQAIYEYKYASFASLPYYDKEMSFYGPQFSGLLSHIQETDHASKTLIDLGCGFGMKTHIMKRYFQKVSGVDFADNIIKVNNLLSNDPNLTFQTADVNDNEVSTEKFDYIIGNGLSVFNQKDLSECTPIMKDLIKKYGKHSGVFIIWSFTNFTSSAPSGWYNHSKSELNLWLKELNNYPEFNCQIYFPFKNIKWGKTSFKSLLFSIYRYFRKRQYYFIIIKYGFQESQG